MAAVRKFFVGGNFKSESSPCFWMDGVGEKLAGSMMAVETNGEGRGKRTEGYDDDDQ